MTVRRHVVPASDRLAMLEPAYGCGTNFDFFHIEGVL